MTDRLKGAIVTFDRDIREDDADGILAAIAHIKGIVSVQPVQAEAGDVITAMRVKAAIASKMYDFLSEIEKV